MGKPRIFLLLLLFFLIGKYSFSVQQGILKEVLTPEGIEISGNEIYIIEGAIIYVYSLDDIKLLRKFGSEGEGPGELKVTPWLSNLIFVLPDSVVVDSMDKMIVFSKEGKVLQERKRSYQFTQMVPVGINFAVRKRIVEEKMQYSTINCYDPESEKTKELYRQPFAPRAGRSLNMVPDAIHFCVYEDRIFIEESPKGFFIEVFDSKGKKLYQIENKFTKIPVTRKDKLEIEEIVRVDPFMRIQSGGWDQMKKEYKLDYPNTFPAIQGLVVSNNKIYIQTYKKQENKEEYIILDLQGHILNKVFLPIVRKPGYTEQMMGTGVKLFSIYKNKFYYIVEKDQWCELHVEEIK